MSAASEDGVSLARPSHSAPRVVPPREAIGGSQNRLLSTGAWGSLQSGGLNDRLLTVTQSGATFRSECSSGTINQVISLDAQGHFESSGLYQVQAGPVGMPNEARFIGDVVGEKMSLTIVVPTTGSVFGPYALQLGQQPRIGTCPIL